MRTPPLALYIHFPWCLKKCPYCDFNSHAVRGRLPTELYLRRLLQDLDGDLEWLSGRRPLTPPISIFLGGGTPSLFPPEGIGELLEAIRRRLPWEGEIEITLEANPARLERPRLRELAACGINRLSLGVQSFQDHLLKRIGRLHTAQEAVRAVEEAKRCGFRSLNIDLMYGLPGQTLEEAIRDIEMAIRLDPDHLSYYQLTIEAGTPFAKKRPTLPDEEVIAAIEREGRGRLEMAGYRRYEISAFAKEGHRCCHNLNYWRFGDYLGIGAGAHGKITDLRHRTLWRLAKNRSPGRYLEGSFREHLVEVPEGERPLEFLMNRLRLREGFTPREFETATGMGWAAIEPEIAALARHGFLEMGDEIACSAWGWERLDALLVAFMELMEERKCRTEPEGLEIDGAGMVAQSEISS